MISKKTGPITVLVKICSSRPPPGLPSIRSRFRCSRVERLAVTGQARVDHLVVGIRHVHELDVARPQRLDGGVDVGGAQRDVLDALAAIGAQIFLDLRLVVGRFVDGDADLAAGAGHRPALQAGQLALDVEVADLPEVEEPLVEVRPQVHAAAMDVVGEVIDIGQAGAARVGLHARHGHEVDVVDAAVAVAIDQEDQAVADALDGRDVQLHRADLALHRLGAERLRPLQGGAGILDAKGHGADRRSVHAGEGLGEAVGLGVDDEVDLALAIERHVLRAVAGHRREAERLEQGLELADVGGGVFDELEAVGGHGIDGVGSGWLRSALRHGDLLSAGPARRF